MLHRQTHKHNENHVLHQKCCTHALSYCHWFEQPASDDASTESPTSFGCKFEIEYFRSEKPQKNPTSVIVPFIQSIPTKTIYFPFIQRRPFYQMYSGQHTGMAVCVVDVTKCLQMQHSAHNIVYHFVGNKRTIFHMVATSIKNTRYTFRCANERNKKRHTTVIGAVILDWLLFVCDLIALQFHFF